MAPVLVFLIDLVLAVLAVESSAGLVRWAFHPEAILGFQGTTVAASASVGVAALGTYLTGLHSPAVLLQHRQIVARTALVSVGVVLTMLVVAYFVWYTPIGRTSLIIVGVLTFLFLVSWRLLFGWFLARGPRVPMLVLGTGRVERRFAARLNTLAHTRFEVCGFVEDASREPARRPGESGPDPSASGVVLGVPLPANIEIPPVRGQIDDALELCRREGIAHAVVVGASGLSDAQVRAMTELQAHGIRVHTAGTVWMDVALQLPIDMVDARWVLNTFEQLDRPVVLAAKRLVDVVCASLGLLVFAPMMPFLWLIQRIDDPGPFFYSQARVGAAGREFRVHKIRTMRVSQDGEQRWAGTRDDRTTRFSRLLRRLRIDEFPQFWNVLRGDMSLVGPRPEQPKIVDQLEREIPYFGYRHLVKPGITGWAQIHQGYAASVGESAVKLSYDLYYVGRLSVLMDLDIMLRTVFVMVARIGSR